MTENIEKFIMNGNSAIANFKAITESERSDELLDTICAHIANGGSPIDLAELWHVRFSDLERWLNDIESGRQKRYVEASKAQTEWVIQRILAELRSISFGDVSKLFNDDHSLKPVSEWPVEARRAIKEIEVNELFDGFGKDREQVGYTKKVKLVDKVKSIEMLMKNLNMLTDRAIVLNADADDEKFCDEFFGLPTKK